MWQSSLIILVIITQWGKASFWQSSLIIGCKPSKSVDVLYYHYNHTVEKRWLCQSSLIIDCKGPSKSLEVHNILYYHHKCFHLNAQPFWLTFLDRYHQHWHHHHPHYLTNPRSPIIHQAGKWRFNTSSNKTVQQVLAENLQSPSSAIPRSPIIHLAGKWSKKAVNLRNLFKKFLQKKAFYP